jgi:hypothetical protein
VRLLKELYGVTLPDPSLDYCLNQLKKFCTELVEENVSHPWRTVIVSLSARARMSIAHSLFLFRKVIPQEKPRVEDYCSRMAEDQPKPDPEFQHFAVELTRRIFGCGWDSAYCRIASTSSLSVSSCSERSRSEGGGRGLMVQDRMLRAEFCSYVMTSCKSLTRGVSRVNVVESGGKWRTISIPPSIDGALRPLHKAMYAHLSRFEWLLRGDAKANRFKDFHRVPGEIFISGDYESATDHLNSHLQLAILNELLDSSWRVPEGVKDHVRSLYSEPVLEYGGVTYVKRRGQLMGDLTSFPLLCLINYITFRYCIRRKVPVRINGDDIVFRATPEEAASWERGVAKGGLKLSQGKTMRNSRFFTLNSALFEGLGNKDRRVGAAGVGFVRARAIWPGSSVAESTLSLSDRFHSVAPSMGRQRARVVREFFLRQNEKFVHASRRSITRGLGLSVDREMLHSLGMWHRELFYLEQPVERPLPVLVSGGVPEGFVQVQASKIGPDLARQGEDRFKSALLHLAWTEPYDPKNFNDDAIFRRIREGASPYGINHFKGIGKVRRMLRCSRRTLWKWVYLRCNESLFGRERSQRGKCVWVSQDMLCSIRQYVNFVKPV